MASSTDASTDCAANMFNAIDYPVSRKSAPNDLWQLNPHERLPCAPWCVAITQLGMKQLMGIIDQFDALPTQYVKTLPHFIRRAINVAPNWITHATTPAGVRWGSCTAMYG